LNKDRKPERKTDYEALYKAMESVKDDMIGKNLKSLACPWGMSSALAGGDFRIVSSMLEVVFCDAGIQVTAYKLD